MQLLALDAAAGRDLDWVFVLGLTSARMPGGRLRAGETIPDALLKEALGPDDRGAHVASMRRLAYVAMTRAARGLVLAYPALSASGVAQPPSPFAEEARRALGAAWEVLEEELFGPEEALHATFQALRDELLADVARVGKGLGELRLDTDLDVTHAVARYLELVKLAALIERPAGQSVAEALGPVNQRLGQALSPLQREVLQTSSLDALLLDAERDDRARAAARAARTEPSLQAFLPRRGDGLALSASDIETYRSCPLRYKFARVLRVPQEPTLNQRFGILVHQVLERYHQSAEDSLDELLNLLDWGWRRGGFGDSDEERQLRGKAGSALRRYYQRVADEPVQPVWFERAFSFRMGRHTLRGRVDRVDRLADGGYELIDYKTGRPRSAAALREDVQLSLYAVGAREAWQLDATPAGLPLRARRREGARAELGDRRELDRRHGRRGRRRDPRPGLRADAVLYGLLDVRLPDRVPGGGAMTAIRRAMPVVFTDDPDGSRAFYEDFLGFTVGMEQPGFLMLQVAERADDAGPPRMGRSGRDGPAGASHRHVDRGRGLRARRTPMPSPAGWTSSIR